MKHQVVIIGSGLGGLLTGVLLAKEGYDVAILEQNKQVGGCLQTFSFDKKVFDSAVHYIGSLQEEQVMYRIFSYVGIQSNLQLQQLDLDCFDAVILDSNTSIFKLGQGSAGFREGLLDAFPNEKDAIRQYYKLLQDTCQAYPLYNLRMGNESEKQAYAHLSLHEVLHQIGASEALQSVLTGNAILYAGNAHHTSWSTHALVSKSYIDSAWRCVGGASQIAKLLWRQLQAYGGKIYKNEKVQLLETKEGEIIAAHTASGSRFEAEYFISNVHPKQTLSWVDDDGLFKKVYKNRIHNTKESIGCLMLNIVLELQKVAYKNYNINWNDGHPLLTAEKVANNFPSNYSIYYTEDAQNKGFAESVSILAYVNAAWFEKWKESFNSTANVSERDAAYHAFKQSKANQLLDKISERFPEIKQFEKSRKIATPLTYRDYQGSGEGSLYGIQKDVHHLNATQLSPKTRIPNLFLTGQNVNLHGVLGVAMTAITTASNFLGMENILHKIK